MQNLNYNQKSLLKSFRFTQPQLNKLLQEYQSYGFTQHQILTAWQQCGQNIAAFHDTLIQNRQSIHLDSKLDENKKRDFLQSQLQIKQKRSNSNTLLYQSISPQELQQLESQSLIDQLKTETPQSDKWVPIGLINLGNTCYINIMLQYMFNIVPFRQLVFNLPFGSTATAGQPLLKKLQELFALMQNGNRNHVNPSSLLDALQEFKPSSFLMNGEQNDYYELQILFLDAIEQAVLELNNDNFTNEFKQIFYGESEERLICDKKVIKTTPTQFGSISIEIREGNLLKAFTTSLMLYIDDYETQDKIKTKVMIHQCIKSPPKILQFYLNRTEYDIQLTDVVKNNTQFQFPTSIDVNQYIQDKSIIQSKEMWDLEKQEEEVLQYLKQCGDEQESTFDKMIAIFTQSCKLFAQDPKFMSNEAMINELTLQKERYANRRIELQNQYSKIVEQKKRLIEKSKNIYTLTAVLMHSGSAKCGHYYCYLYDGKKWWKFNDRLVTQVEYPQVYSDALGQNNQSANVTGLIYVHNDLLNQNRVIKLDRSLLNFVNTENQHFLTIIDKQNILKRKPIILQKAGEFRINYPNSQLGKALIKYQFFEEFLEGNPNRSLYIRKTILELELQFISKQLYCAEKIDEYQKYFIKNSGLFPTNFENLFFQDHQQFLFKNNIIATFNIQSQINTSNVQQMANSLQKYCQQLLQIDQAAGTQMQVLFQAVLLKGCFLCDLNIQKNKFPEAKQLIQFLLDINKTSQFIHTLITQQLRENIKCSLDELEHRQKKQGNAGKSLIQSPSIIVPDAIPKQGFLGLQNLQDIINKIDELEVNLELWLKFRKKIIENTEIMPQKKRLELEMPLYFDDKIY